jgi:hypothetical protein
MSNNYPFEKITAVVSATKTHATQGLKSHDVEVIDQPMFRNWLDDEQLGEQAPIVVANALGWILEKESGLSNAQIYEQMHAMLCGTLPLEHGPLLKFMALCIEAVRSTISVRATHALSVASDLTADIETLPDNPWISITLASIFPTQILTRLLTFETLRKQHLKSGQIFELAEYIGCTDLEISRLLDTTPEKVESRRVSFKRQLEQFQAR